MNFRIEKKESFQIMGLSVVDANEKVEGMTTLWNDFLENYDPKIYKYYTAPFWQIGAYDFESIDGKTKMIIGAEHKGSMPDGVNLDIKDIPSATWAVFSIKGNTGFDAYNAAYTRIITEWFPASQYKRDESVPNLDSYPGGKIDENYVWEIWIPVLNK